MRALRFDGAKMVMDRAAPEPTTPSGAAGQWAIVRPTRTAVSEQDLDVSRGGSGFIGCLGREWAGVVERLIGDAPAAEAKRWTGKRVAGSAWFACGVCDLCRGGLANHCRAGRIMGLRGADGCIADLFAAPVTSLVEIPRDVDDDGAVFTDLLSRAIHAGQQSRSDGRSMPTVVGDGALALLTAQVILPQCAKVRVVGWREPHIALCERWGMKHRLAGDVGLRADQTAVIECSGTGEGLFVAASMVRPRGRLVLAAAIADRDDAGRTKAIEALRLAHERELEIVGSRGGSAPEAVGLLQRGGVDVISLITRRMKFADAIEAVRVAARPEQIRVLMEM